MFLESIEIIVGTYEEYLLGYMPKHVDEVYRLTQTFASHDHKASIRCVASNGKMLASGGADDSVILYDMSSRTQSGCLMHHSGTVSCIEYAPNGSHLLTGGNDGLLAIHRVQNFELEKTWGSAHKGSAILDLSVHPTGKLALTVGADATLRTWNLVKGRRAYATCLGSAKCGAAWQISGVSWSPDGRFYVLGMGSRVDVYLVESAAIVYSFATVTKVSSFCFISGNRLCIGCEGGVMYIHVIEKKSCLMEQKIHEERVKCLKSVEFEDHVYIVSASSSGQIKLWEYVEKSLNELCEVKTGCRITCLTITTCGYPENFKTEETETKEEDELEESLFEGIRRIPLRRQGVVELEVEDEQKKKSSKRKKKGLNKSKISLEREPEYEKPRKKKKAHESEIPNTFKLKKKKEKKRKSSLADSWEVSSVV